VAASGQIWLTAIEADDGQPELRSFATGIRHDQQAVINGLTLGSGWPPTVARDGKSGSGRTRWEDAGPAALSRDHGRLLCSAVDFGGGSA
jgi:hypothetical protein